MPKTKKLGLSGLSYFAGHVVYVAARDPRVKAFVSQVGKVDSCGAIQSAALRKFAYNQGTDRARGKIGYPRPGEKFGTLTGAPVIEKLASYAPIEDIGWCKDCAKLFIIAENEELFDNKKPGCRGVGATAPISSRSLRRRPYTVLRTKTQSLKAPGE
jgi:hypothetical protein